MAINEYKAEQHRREEKPITRVRKLAENKLRLEMAMFCVNSIDIGYGVSEFGKNAMIKALAKSYNQCSDLK